MVIKDIEEKGLFRFRINLGGFFEVADEDVYLVLGEPTMKEYDRLQRKTETTAEDLSKMMKNCIVDHNLERKEGEKATNEEVMRMLDKFPAALSEVLQVWQEKLPLVQRNREKSENSVPEPLES